MLRTNKKRVVQQVQFVDTEEEMYEEKATESCSFIDRGIEKIINEEIKIIQKVSDTFDSINQLVHFSALPSWMQDNEYLHHGHRPPLNSFSACFYSIFQKHTETGNIWTHMASCILFLLFAVYLIVFSEFSNGLTIKDKLIFGVYFLSVILCLGFSFIFHTVSCHSRKVSKLFSKLDYLGITLLISGSFISCFYFMFYCNTKLQTFYLLFVFLFSMMTSVVCLYEKFSEPKYRTIRASMFLLFGCSGVVPVIHYIYNHHQSVATIDNLKFGFIYLSLMGFFYIAGAILYAGRIPERFVPGKCDYIFQSHQIFHLLVNLSAFFHYLGIREFSEHVIRFQCKI